MVFEFVYTSVLAPTADVLGFSDTIRRARSYNRAHGITGLLVFDGERFCQQLEGEHEQVLLLAAKIEADPVHREFKVLHQGFTGKQRRFGDWPLAYALDTRGTVLDAVSKARGSYAATVLHLRMIDLEIQSPSV